VGTSKVECIVVNLIEVACDIIQWWYFVNRVTSLGSIATAGFLIVEYDLFEEDCVMDLVNLLLN